MTEKVVLVDSFDNDIGEEEKISAHMNGGKLHRAVSVFIFNNDNDLLLQQRAISKYHCPGLWTNTCCTHPRKNELPIDAGKRRLYEEMGFDAEIYKIGEFTYKAPFENGLTEFEFDHVFCGKYDGKVLPNIEEAEGFKWIQMDELKKDIIESPLKYTPWFKIIVDKFF